MVIYRDLLNAYNYLRQQLRKPDNIVAGSAKTLYVRVQILTSFYNLLKCHNLYMIIGSILGISVLVKEFPSFIVVQRNKKSVVL